MNFKFSELPKFYINLSSNVSRREYMEETLAKNKISNYQRFNAVDKLNLKVPETSPKIKEANAAGILACAMSHIEVIKLAKKNKYDAVCVFEDDIVFCDEFHEKIKYLESLPDFDCDIFCLGGHFSNREISSSEARLTQWQGVMQIGQMNGTYGLIITSKVYDFILENWHYGFGADEFFSTHVYSRFKTYALVPFLVGCGKNTSDVTGQSWEYESIKWHFVFPADVWNRNDMIIKNEARPISVTLKNDKFIDLKDCTFIVPVKIESKDREFNFIRCIQHLCNNLVTNIIIKECDSHSPVLYLLKKIDQKRCDIKHIYEHNTNDVFHRTRHLNEMINIARTPVVINYDVDCLLLPETYVVARNKIVREGFDLVYPYGRDEDQVQITFENKEDYTSDLFDRSLHSRWGSYCGHVQFFKTTSYISGFMENENFISYGPEDRERCERFQKLGYNVCWLQGHQVFHIEHSRDKNSSVSNPFYGQAEALYNRLSAMNKEQLLNYYEEQEYLNKYKN
nr:glycosyltransferase family 25 protein [uncultured Flavobacterium sp.]